MSELTKDQKSMLYCYDIVRILGKFNIVTGGSERISAKGIALLDQIRTEENFDIPDEDICGIVQFMGFTKIEDVATVCTYIRQSLELGYYPFIEKMEKFCEDTGISKTTTDLTEGTESTD